MASEVESWRQDAATKAEGIARDVERLSHQARAAGLSVTAYILGLAVEEARKEAGTEAGKVQHASSWRRLRIRKATPIKLGGIGGRGASHLLRVPLFRGR